MASLVQQSVLIRTLMNGLEKTQLPTESLLSLRVKCNTQPSKGVSELST